MNDRPLHTPVHKLPAWLSSEDVRQAISEVAAEHNTPNAKAVCWDLSCKISALVGQAAA